MNKRVIATLATTISSGVLLLGATPAAAAPQQAVNPRPAATTPDGKTIRLSEFIGSYYAILSPASAGDSAWTEGYVSTGTPTPIGKKTAATNVAELTSSVQGFFWGTYRACASTAGTVTCTAWNRAV